MDSQFADLRSLPVFDGFPYLNTRVAPAFYHIILLSAYMPETDLTDMARRQVWSNRLPSCLVLASDRAKYFQPDGGGLMSVDPPRGGSLLAGKLAPAVDLRDSSEEFVGRQKKLAGVIEQACRFGGFAFGDLTKGGRPATEKEQRALGGFQADGTPLGLTLCAQCGDWKGVCLDPSEQFAGQMMTVHCFCDNHNQCARCGTQLFERRLNANYYNPHDRSIWHVPGFCGLRHQCPTRDGAQAELRRRTELR